MHWHFYRVLGVVLDAVPRWLLGRWVWLRRLEDWALIGFAVTSSERLLKRGGHASRR